MIQLTPPQKIQYQMLSQIVVLLVVYACLMLLSALQTLPYPTLAHQLPPLTDLTMRWLHLIILTGIVMAGVCQLDNPNLRYLLWLYRLWWVLIILTFLLGIPLLDICVAVMLFAYLMLSTINTTETPFIRVWQVGVMLIIGCLLAQVVVSSMGAIILANVRVMVAYGITGISILFWLITRWSNVRQEWTRDGVYIVSGLIALAGSLISFAPLKYPSWLGIVAGLIILICFMIFAGHSYRALRDRNRNLSLSPHWVAIGVLFWLGGGGFLGIISTQAGLQTWIQNTPLMSSQTGFMMWGLLALILSLVNYMATDLRGDNRRVTGYMPLWLIAFGQGLSLMMQACIGVVDIYLRQMLLLNQYTVDVLLTPLIVIWIMCLMAVAFGIAIYALGFWVRRPEFI